MATAGNRARMTVDLGDPELYKAVRHAAIELDRPIRAIMVEALRKWLEDLEEQEDLAAMDATEGEPAVPWQEVKAQIRAAEARGE